jgi:hypothetical protein
MAITEATMMLITQQANTVSMPQIDHPDDKYT